MLATSLSREEIATQLWREGVFVDVDAGIHSAILKIRHALGDSGRRSRFIKTVSGKGYRFEARVSALRGQAPRPTPDATPRPPVSQPARHCLPAELSSFVGRRKELDELARTLAAARLVTLTGPGGVGKTRLALRGALALSPKFGDGACLIDLGSLSGPELVSETIATALGLQGDRQRSAREQIREYLLDRELLLILDTCEHVIHACAELAHELLRHAPRLSVLATSREPLSIPGEVVFTVPPLSISKDTDAGAAPLPGEAVLLFIERASAVHSRFEADAEKSDVIVRICRRLDGIPLAIELAAARIAMLSVEQIEARLQNRFRLFWPVLPAQTQGIP